MSEQPPKPSPYVRGYATGIYAALEIIESYRRVTTHYEKHFGENGEDEVRATSKVLKEIARKLRALHPSKATTKTHRRSRPATNHGHDDTTRPFKII